MAVLNKDNALYIMVNLEIIRKLFFYSKMRSSGEYDMPKFYKELIRISRPRFLRICNGDNFQITGDERKYLADFFGIGEKYFNIDTRGSLIQINDIREDDWKCYFNEKFYTGYELAVPPAQQESNALKVTNVLKSLTHEAVQRDYGTDKALFRISYRFDENKVFKDEKPINRFIRELETLKVKDWENVDTDKLEAYKKKLDEHSQFIQALITINKYST